MIDALGGLIPPGGPLGLGGGRSPSVGAFVKGCGRFWPCGRIGEGVLESRRFLNCGQYDFYM